LPETGWTLTPDDVRRRFDATAGRDPVFRPVDGANNPEADVSSEGARRRAYGLLLARAVIRIGLTIPKDAEFELADADDPYDFASDEELSLFRRPLPSTNLRFLSAVMWDGRESPPGRSLEDSLAHQANSAAQQHGEADDPLPDARRRAIVAFEIGLLSGQVRDRAAGDLATNGAAGGPEPLAQQPFYIGINDPFGQNPQKAPFDARAFTLFGSWLERSAGGERRRDGDDDARAAIARGERLFDTRPMNLTGVAGLNDELGQSRVVGFCSTCHNVPNAGNQSVPAFMNIGVSDERSRTPDMPLYTLRHKTTRAVVKTTDPGRALSTGRWADVGRFKSPVLRGLAARPPFFHDGSAATLEDVVGFYDTRFGMGLTGAEKADLAAFLRAL
jgi:hypothetical protein